jgi:hypothetical protein
VAFYDGNPGRGCCGFPCGARLLEGVHVPVELRCVVGRFDADMARVYLGLAPEGILDRLTDPGLGGGVTVMRSVTPTTPRT